VSWGGQLSYVGDLGVAAVKSVTVERNAVSRSHAATAPSISGDARLSTLGVSAPRQADHLISYY